MIFLFSCFSPTPLVVSDDGHADTMSQQQARMSASSATRELDELMASLSDFKVQSNVSGVQTWADWLVEIFTLVSDREVHLALVFSHTNHEMRHMVSFICLTLFY